MASKTTNRFSPEVRARGVRLVFEHEKDHSSRWATVASIAAKIGCTAQSLNEWVKRAEVDNGVRGGVPTENCRTSEGAGGLRTENSGKRMRSFARRLLISPRRSSQFPDFLTVQAMIAFIDDHRQAYGVEPVCRVLPDRAPSTYRAHLARRARSLPSARQGSPRRRSEDRDRARVRGELSCLWRA